MAEITASQLLAEMKPAWRAALGDRVSHEYIAGFVRRNRVRIEAVLAPIAAAMNVVPEVHVAEPVPQERLSGNVEPRNHEAREAAARQLRPHAARRPAHRCLHYAYGLAGVGRSWRCVADLVNS